MHLIHDCYVACAIVTSVVLLNGELILPYLLFEEAFSYVALGHIFVDTEATKERKSGRVTVLVRA